MLSQLAVQQVTAEAQNGQLESKPGCTLRQTFENEVSFPQVTHGVACVQPFLERR